jgi:GNAT superfamily N-acetyltransferase
MPEVRKATKADVPGLAATLARAFDDDPVIEWAFRNGRSRIRCSERWFRLRLNSLLGHGETYTTADLAGAAIWTLPDRWRTQPVEMLRTIPLLPGAGLGVVKVLRGLDRVERAHPAKPPHYYLAILGTEPDRQGEGIGSALMQPVLEDCDANEIGAYLESSKERNVDFYTRHGFRVKRELDLPRGPRIWLMWRDPR